jgi:hypothetical protein
MKNSDMSREEILYKLREENAANDGKPLTFDIEYRKLLQWLVECIIETDKMPEDTGVGLDIIGPKSAQEQADMLEYRRRLRELKKKYNIKD